MTIPCQAGSQWGIYIETLEGEPIEALHADTHFHPASTTKLWTTAAALKAFGPEHTFTTTLWTNDRGEVLLRGGGDPALTSRQLAPYTITSTDASLFGEVFHGADWAWDDIGLPYCPEISSLTIDQKALASGPPIDAPTLLATIPSPPIADLIHPVNKVSDNLYAEVLFCHLGNDGYENLFKALNISPDEICLRNGSGAGRRTLITPRQTVTLLQHMKDSLPFVESLPIAGIDGSLKNRLLDLPVRAKTGSLADAGALAGYATCKSGKRIAFCIVVNASLTNPAPEIDAYLADFLATH